MNRIRKIVIALSLALPAAGALADQPTQSDQSPTAQAAPASAHLGVLVRNIPSLAAQLPPEVPRGQGVMVAQVQPGSPAAQAGLHNFDILLSYDDQKLFSADQLSALVANDQPGRKVRLQVVHAGKVGDVQVELGQGAAQQPMPWQAAPYPMPHPVMPHPMRPQMPERQPLPEISSETFESLSVEKLDNGRYRAAIEYLGPDGKKRSYKYQGSRAEIQQQIRQTRDLPPPARQQLLNALGMQPHWPPMNGFGGPFVDPDTLFQRWRQGAW